MTGFTAKGFLYHYRVSPKEAFKGPEPDDGKPSRPVLRGPTPSNGGRLLGSSVIEIYQQLGKRSHFCTGLAAVEEHPEVAGSRVNSVASLSLFTVSWSAPPKMNTNA